MVKRHVIGQRMVRSVPPFLSEAVARHNGALRRSCVRRGHPSSGRHPVEERGLPKDL